MLLKWNKDHINGIPVVTGNETTGALSKSMMVTLIPGWNEVTFQQFEIILPMIKDKIEDGSIEVYGKKEKNEAGEMVYVDQLFIDVRKDFARDIIRECYNPKLLNKWLNDPKVEKEHYVALTQRLAEIDDAFKE